MGQEIQIREKKKKTFLEKQILEIEQQKLQEYRNRNSDIPKYKLQKCRNTNDRNTEIEIT